MLSSSHVQSSTQPSPRSIRKLAKKISKAVMKSHKIAIPKYDLPLRLRPWFLLLTFVIMLLLAFLGLTNFSRSLPLNNKFLHLTCFCIATGVFYFIFDVDEDARRVWFWRHANLIFTAIVCFFFGGFVSEIVQSLLPYKHFDFGDVVANIIGSAIGLYISYHIEKHYRARREIARLYRPVNTDDHVDTEDYSDEESGSSGAQLLPLFNTQQNSSLAKLSAPSKSRTQKASRLADVWDEHEETFGIGDDSESEDAPTPRPFGHSSRAPQVGTVPTITITPS